jgi:hypothetical protein
MPLDYTTCIWFTSWAAWSSTTSRDAFPWCFVHRPVLNSNWVKQSDVQPRIPPPSILFIRKSEQPVHLAAIHSLCLVRVQTIWTRTPQVAQHTHTHVTDRFGITNNFELWQWYLGFKRKKSTESHHVCVRKYCTRTTSWHTDHGTLGSTMTSLFQEFEGRCTNRAEENAGTVRFTAIWGGCCATLLT